jgi:hypothetical protein
MIRNPFARSQADLGLQSTTLLYEIERKRGVEKHSWVPRDYLEQCSFPETCPPPLRVAAVDGWEKLVRLLIENGANPRDESYVFRSFHTSDYGFSQNRTQHLHFGDSVRVPILSELFARFELSFHPDTSPEDIVAEGIRVFMGAQLLLHVASSVGLQTKLSTAEELHVLHGSTGGWRVRNRSKLPQDRVEEVWSALTSNYKRNIVGRLPDDMGPGIVAVATSQFDWLSLSYILQMGYGSNGRWWHRITTTPLDHVLISGFQASKPEGSAKCRSILEEHGACRGLCYMFEVQLLATLFAATCLVGLFPSVYFSFKLVNDWYLPYFVKMAGRIEKSSSATGRFFLTFGAVFAYLAYLFPLLLLILILFLLLRAITSAYERLVDMRGLTLVNYAAILFPLAYYLIDLEDLTISDAISLMYGPTLSRLRHICGLFKTNGSGAETSNNQRYALDNLRDKRDTKVSFRLPLAQATTNVAPPPLQSDQLDTTKETPTLLDKAGPQNESNRETGVMDLESHPNAADAVAYRDSEKTKYESS